MDKKRTHFDTTAVIGAITHEHGVLTWKQYPRSVNNDRFKEFLLVIRTRLKKRKVYVLMNFSVMMQKDAPQLLGLTSIIRFSELGSRLRSLPETSMSSWCPSADTLLCQPPWPR